MHHLARKNNIRQPVYLSAPGSLLQMTFVALLSTANIKHTTILMVHISKQSTDKRSTSAAYYCALIATCTRQTLCTHYIPLYIVYCFTLCVFFIFFFFLFFALVANKGVIKLLTYVQLKQPLSNHCK